MPKPISRDNAAQYFWGEGCASWHLLRDPNLSVIEESVPPGACEVVHFHERAQQFFFILSGKATMVVEGEPTTFGVGQGLSIPPGVSHQFRNESNEQVTFLVISQPPSHGDRVEQASSREDSTE